MSASISASPAASVSGVVPSAAAARPSAPSARRRAATTKRPALAARWSGVKPESSRAATTAPCDVGG